MPRSRASQTNYNHEAIAAMLMRQGYQVRTNVLIGENIYGTGLRVGVLVNGITRFPNGLIIESRTQEITGTTDEKLPYLVLNIREKYPHPTVLILDGDGFRPGAVVWVEEQVNEKLIRVFTKLGHFRDWLIAIVDSEAK
ncbi:MAG: PD-(D/E)XK nuclease superfamily protein [Acidobacteriota bacterium]